MKQFDLSLWLKDKSRKVVTRNGKPVRIVCWDKLGDYPIIGCIKYSDDYEDLESYDSNGFKYSFDREDRNDIFFADEEELTELQKTLEEDCDCYVNLYNDGKTREELREWIKGWCPRIIDLARKEIQPEIDEKLKEEYDCGYSIGKFDAGEAKVKELVAEFEKGRTNALKDLPKWKRDCFHNITSIVDGRLFYNGYYIDINELEKLPKEE